MIRVRFWLELFVMDAPVSCSKTKGIIVPRARTENFSGFFIC